MQISINKIRHELAAGASLADALALLEAKPPFAAAVNLQHVPNNQYAQKILQPEDRIDIIFPVTGG